MIFVLTFGVMRMDFLYVKTIMYLFPGATGIVSPLEPEKLEKSEI